MKTSPIPNALPPAIPTIRVATPSPRAAATLAVTPQPLRHPSPVRQHRLLVIGVGSIGERHLRCFAATGRTLCSFCEPNEAMRQAVGRRYQVCCTYPDLDEAMAQPHDVAVICTPASSHTGIATKLVEAGVHVLIEKPLSTTVDGIDQLQQMARDRGVVVAVAYIYRAAPALAAMRRALIEGQFGRPVQLVAVGGQHFPTYRPAYRDTYYRSHATGGGAIQDALTHVLNAGEWLVGPIDRVVADAAHQVLEGVDVEDTVHVAARHGDVLASYCLNQHQAPNELTITVVCERGTCRFEMHRHRWSWMLQPDTEWREQAHDVRERDALFVQQANAFLDAVELGRTPLCTLDEGYQTLRAHLAVMRSTVDAARFMAV